MDAVSPRSAGRRAAPDALGQTAQLPARVVARVHPRQWADSGLPDSLAALDIPLETVWAAVQLALSGADQHTLVSTLGLSDDNALRIIIATTESLITDPATVTTTGADITDTSPPPAPAT
ncbi:MAG: hypothetical protein ACRDR6_24015 [Pseudonocardiaceae bacterium]